MVGLRNKGFVEIDVLLAIAMLALIVFSLGGAWIGSLQSVVLRRDSDRATQLADDALEIAQVLQSDAWNELEDGTGIFTKVSGNWTFDTGIASESIEKFTRSITVQDICRDGTYNIVTCPGDYVDPHTKLVTTTVSWVTVLGVLQEVSEEMYLSNYHSSVWTQTDWVGGSGQSTWSNADAYDADDGNVNIATAGEVSLLQSGGACGSFTWDYDTAGDYSFDAGKIGINGSYAELIEPVASENWWNGNYAYRQQLTVTTGANSPYNGYQDYTVRIDSLNTQSLITATKMQADCDDLRVVYFDGLTSTELDREVIDCNTTSTDLRFPLQTDISASTATTAYYVYYGNASAGTGPEDLSTVYLWYDDASTNQLANYVLGRGDEWHGTDGANSITWNAGGYYAYDTGDNFTNSIRIDDAVLSERDAYIEMDFYHTDAYPNNMTTGLVGRYIADSGEGTAFETSDVYYATNRADSPSQGAGYVHDGDIMKEDRGTVAIDGPVQPEIINNQYRRQALALWGVNGTNGSFWDADATATLGPSGWPSVAPITTGTDSTDIEGAGEWGAIMAQDQGRIDNILIRRYVEPEPVVATSSEEAYIAGSYTDIAEITAPTLIDPFGFYRGDAIHIAGNIYAIAYQGPGNDGFILTVEVDAAGTIVNTNVDQVEFDTSRGFEPEIIHVSGDIYAIAYRGPGNDGFIQTVEINSAGTISLAGMTNYEYEPSRGVYPDIINLSSNYFAIVYQGSGNDGFVETVQIATDGSSITTIDSWEYNTSSGYEPRIVHLDGTYYAVAHEANQSDGEIDTFQISNTGVITKSIIDNWEFDTSNGEYVDFYPVSGTVYSIAYNGPFDNGKIVTFNISNIGVITPSFIDDVTFSGTAFGPNVLSIAGLYVVAYQSSGNDGGMYLYDIDASGIVSLITTTEFIFDAGTAQFPNMFALGSDTFLVNYTGSGGVGYLGTYELLGASGYSTDIPPIEAVNTFSAPSPQQWIFFHETAEKNGGEIYYQLSIDDGVTWLWWNGSTWIVATTAGDYNTATEISDNLHNLSAATSQIRVKAFFESDGSQQVRLDAVEIGCGGLQAESGTVVADENWTVVPLQHLYTDPIIVASATDTANTSSQSVRIRNRQSGQFEIRIHNPQNANVNNETISYFVVERGVWNLGGSLIEAGIVQTDSVGNFGSGYSGAGEVRTFKQVYGTPPVVMHTVASDNDTDWITSFVTGDSSTTPPSTTQYRIGLNAAEVASSYVHDAEDIGYVVFGSGEFTVGSSIMEANVTTTSISGYDNGCSTVAYTSVFTATPNTLVTLQEMNGINGGWMTQCSNSLTSIGMHVQEDQVNDTERAHIAESGAYLAFSEDINFSTYSGGGGAYVVNGELTSSAFEMGENSAAVTIEWDEDISACTGCDVQFEVRVAPDNTGVPGVWSDWVGVNGTGTYFEIPTGDRIDPTLNGNHWVQYRLTLSGDGSTTPILEEVRVYYQ